MNINTKDMTIKIFILFLIVIMLFIWIYGDKYEIQIVKTTTIVIYITAITIGINLLRGKTLGGGDGVIDLGIIMLAVMFMLMTPSTGKVIITIQDIALIVTISITITIVKLLTERRKQNAHTNRN